MNVLLLAGTTEARALAAMLAAEPGVELTASLAGHTSAAAAYPCAVRTGGFGGVGGLVAHLRRDGVDTLVDATHPFSAAMPRHAAEAAARAGIPRLRLVRPPWAPQPGDRWVDVADLAGAARAVADLGSRRVLLTVGRLGLAAFAGVEARFVVRTIDPPDAVLPAAETVRARGPFTVEEELALLRDRRIEALVTKNAGGSDAKLVAARRLGLPVVVVRRPPAVEGPHAATADEALAWVLGGVA